nr:MAG TPA: hypothetical protein [Caudoviricetes sp.]
MAEKDTKKARRTILQAYYTKKKVFYLLKVKSEGCGGKGHKKSP